ncbi:unnamed protein product [Thlaspi arvense]|uniref:YDG domain-containing protein n=1 Tax=Thlaspi arvense TaxID=13288 RepID=A0AAU9RS54_THLAR|nr:unnamed protein product [Thlaspi arvense]
MKNAGSNLSTNGNVGMGSFDVAKRKLPPSRGSKVKPLSLEESKRLIASQGRGGQLSASSSIRRKLVVVKVLKNQRNSQEKKKTLSIETVPRTKTHKPAQNRDERLSNQTGFIPVMQQNHKTKALSPREKVLKVLRIFKKVYEELDRDKAARRGESKTATSPIDYKTRAILMSSGMQVNAVNRIGAVPGIEIGDEFQYKAELNLIGLHFGIRSGIDYIDTGGSMLATNIVSSEGSGYVDRFDCDEIIYSGQGGDVRGKDHNKVTKDQKLVTGNLALVNSMKSKTPVRVIYGKKRVDQRQRGKSYVYVGLYLVQHYRQVKGPKGNVLFQFTLRRVSGQPSVDLRD